MSTDGGQAFPGRELDYRGMSLRDWFAGQALAGMLANAHYSKTWGDRPPDDFAPHCARMAYEAADDMLAARERKES